MKSSEMKICNTKLIKSKSNKYESLKGEEILPPDQSLIIEQTNYKYYPLGKAKKTKLLKIIEKKKQRL